jgi:hypothetical protein
MTGSTILFKTTEIPEPSADNGNYYWDEVWNFLGQRSGEGYCEVLLDSLEEVNNKLVCGGRNAPAIYYTKIAFPVGTEGSVYSFSANLAV